MWMWTSVLRFIKELNVKSRVGARYYQLQVAEINPLESGEDSAFPAAAAAAAPCFPQQSAASILIKSQLFPGMSLTQYLDQISPSSTSNHHDTAAFNILCRGEHFTKLLFEFMRCLDTAILTWTFSTEYKKPCVWPSSKIKLVEYSKENLTGL